MWLFKSRLFKAWNFAARMFQGAPSSSPTLIPVVWAEVWQEKPEWCDIVHTGEEFAELLPCSPVYIEINGVSAMLQRVIRTEFVEGQGCILRAYLPDGPATAPGEYGDPITQADVGSVSITVTSGGTAVSGYDGLSLAVGDVILDTLQGVGDPRIDGVNFAYNIPGDAFPDAGEMATVVVTVVSDDETKTWLIEASGRVRAAGE